MSKPWKQDAGGARLEAFLGAFGVRTSQFQTTEQLLAAAATLYEMNFQAGVSVAEAAKKIGALSKSARSKLAHKNMAKVCGLPVAQGDAASNVTPEGLDRMMAASAPVLIDGHKMDVTGELDIDPAQLLRKVVSAVISSGHAEILWEFPEVLAFFGSRIPSQLEAQHLHNVDRRMFEAKARWPGVMPDRL